jgi:hypothetical protein
MLEKLLDEQEAGRVLGGNKPLSPRTLQGMRGRGEGPEYVKIGGRLVRYPESALAAYLDRQRRSSTSDTGRSR